MDISDDIYEDLETFDVNLKLNEVLLENEKYLIENKQLKEEVKSQNERILKIEEENVILKENISKLYKTSLLDTRKKSNLITTLRRQMNDFVFRRNGHQPNDLKRHCEDENIEQNKRFKFDQNNPEYVKPPEPTDPPPESPDCIKRPNSRESPNKTDKFKIKQTDQHRGKKSKRESDYKEKERNRSSKDRYRRSRYRDDSRDRWQDRHRRDNPKRRYEYSRDTRRASVSRSIHKSLDSRVKNYERSKRASSRSNFEFKVPHSHEKRREKRSKSPKRARLNLQNDSKKDRETAARFSSSSSPEIEKPKFPLQNVFQRRQHKKLTEIGLIQSKPVEIVKDDIENLSQFGIETLQKIHEETKKELAEISETDNANSSPRLFNHFVKLNDTRPSTPDGLKEISQGNWNLKPIELEALKPRDPDPRLHFANLKDLSKPLLSDEVQHLSPLELETLEKIRSGSKSNRIEEVCEPEVVNHLKKHQSDAESPLELETLEKIRSGSKVNWTEEVCEPEAVNHLKKHQSDAESPLELEILEKIRSGSKVNRIEEVCEPEVVNDLKKHQSDAEEVVVKENGISRETNCTVETLKGSVKSKGTKMGDASVYSDYLDIMSNPRELNEFVSDSDTNSSLYKQIQEPPTTRRSLRNRTKSVTKESEEKNKSKENPKKKSVKKLGAETSPGILQYFTPENESPSNTTQNIEPTDSAVIIRSLVDQLVETVNPPGKTRKKRCKKSPLIENLNNNDQKVVNVGTEFQIFERVARTEISPSLSVRVLSETIVTPANQPLISPKKDLKSTPKKSICDIEEAMAKIHSTPTSQTAAEEGCDEIQLLLDDTCSVLETHATVDNKSLINRRKSYDEKIEKLKNSLMEVEKTCSPANTPTHVPESISSQSAAVVPEEQQPHLEKSPVTVFKNQNSTYRREIINDNKIRIVVQRNRRR